MGRTSEIGGLISAVAASFSFSQSNLVSFADGVNFSPFSSSNPSPSPSQTPSLSGQSQPSTLPPSTVAGSGESGPRAPRNDNPRTTSAGFDPEALERGAKALKEITSSSHAKKVETLLERK
ncbi:putative ATP-ASE [Salix purpurea]|uniref:ATP-ASE n=1 Tax=Salix purpurea TaxID=77065 RepID=A0A9Q0VQX7_SALPP|nr:putative ATP-ASE [Salix purpurea]